MQYEVKKVITAANTTRVTVSLPAEKFESVNTTGLDGKAKERKITATVKKLEKELSEELLAFLKPTPVPKVVEPPKTEETKETEKKSVKGGEKS